MNLLLDSHAFIWWDTGADRGGATARAAIADAANQVFVSAASIWELGIKRRTGKFSYNKSLAQSVSVNGFTELAVTGADAEAASALDWDHPDPFDRLLVAQASRHSLTLVTADRAILAVPGIALLRLR